MGIVHTARIETPIGTMRLASTERGLAYVELPHASGRGLDGWLRRCLPGAPVEEGFAPNRAAARQLLEYLEGKRTEFDLPLDPRGTAFQCRVWTALAALPYGETSSYADIARSIGRPKAVRAIGLANGANPVAIVVPCHRVIGADGSLAGYGAGVERKRWLLKLEGIVPTGPTSQIELFPLA